MDGSLIPAGIQEKSSVWNIRGFVIMSLFIQVLLRFMAQLRKKSNNSLIIFVIWLAYFMADWVATFTFGLISNARCNYSISPLQVNENLLAFWAAFLLINLGGPDTITAFSLEDNALWMRYLVGLVAQVFTFLYIFLKTLPNNNLVAHTILVAVAGAIKYGERTRALYLASMENLKKSIGKPPDMSRQLPWYIKKSLSLLPNIQMSSGRHNAPHAERSQSRDFHPEGRSPRGLSFDGMGAKFSPRTVLYENRGRKFCMGDPRTITYYNVIAALVLYCFSRRDGFHEVDI